MKHEEWKPIPHAPLYYASNLGRIAKIIDGKSHTIMYTRIQKGYEHVNLTIKKVRTSRLVHRLVALAFLGEPQNPKMEINHVDGDKLNNVPENLEWTTRSQNIKHYYNSLNGLRNRPRGRSQWQAKFTDDEVRMIRLLASQNNDYRTIALKLNKKVTATNVCNILAQRTYKHVSN